MKACLHKNLIATQSDPFRVNGSPDSCGGSGALEFGHSFETQLRAEDSQKKFSARPLHEPFLLCKNGSSSASFKYFLSSSQV